MDVGGYGDYLYINPYEMKPQERLEDDPSAGVRLDPQELLYQKQEDSIFDQQMGSGYMAGDVFELFQPNYAESSAPVVMQNPSLSQVPELDFGLTGSYHQKDPPVHKIHGRGERERVSHHSSWKKTYSKKSISQELNRIIRKLFSFLKPADRENPDARERLIGTRRSPSALFEEDWYQMLSDDYYNGIPIQPSDGICLRCEDVSNVILCPSCCSELARKDKEFKESLKKLGCIPKQEDNAPTIDIQPSGLFDDQSNQDETEA